ncbi:single-stranded-DNA-specific exonuclease RecJ [Ruminococcus sp. AF25-13]|mgnify:FL=1|jgi:single-stranded-DNA-specific exonuclease|uniref:single-stranded-DNA-specific exonuclease RecJ n=1 Tax=Mediterraneibacter faecis TaxID=592978 RepID=UPI000E414DEF|nr:single-stranded-DNA-specific exonuclease RecJ [Ruminococcus sp. TF10-6]RGF03896.1 single-stranded-DNA-specific exonuclease RecJ [Ruminococcus sp. AM22-14LB]RGF25442.1 single-stranded-DNA-specific exonuclease RecJ [Ruminococcus sp. AM09-18-1]RGG01291.1 single-stranded-DNA-specific exonuclease RecJ [Ruminococcus sp. AF27-3]RGG06729.1 single-stranded-DNA-specific exonuclease RecJ [Ruminococcus sp. AF27-12AA]RGG07610.1 single-stranded-DNA-specific exonuclease RecJ [Ruminococcus sp. AF27-11AA]R
MEKWFVTMKKADFNGIAEKYQISPIIARLMRNRDVIGDEAIDFYLNGTVEDLYDGLLMKDMDRAVDILKEKIEEGKKIRVIGDYDIDGVNATYILQQGLAGLGADVDTDIPDRIKDGYGLNQMLIDRALEDDVDTIVTCDNGIAAMSEIAYGKENGMTIVVTDHHEVPYLEENGKKKYLLPPADAVVDPHRADCEYPFKGLCGAAVAYKLVEVLYRVSGKSEQEVEHLQDNLMENVAIATIGDVMDLVGENRVFVKKGLELLKTTKNEGLHALMQCTGVDTANLNTYHIGFVLGPCINAGGRLDTAKRALELLNASNRREAVTLAADLKELNDSRKEMTEEGVEEAVRQIESSSWKDDQVLVVYLPECHESIAGIIAGRIKERYYRPTFVLTRGETGVKGSGRSIEAYDMFAEMSRCRELFTKFGGHKLAAGLSLEEENVEVFRKRINELADLTEDDLQMKVSIDMRLPFPYINEELIHELKILEPFGKGNGKPLFAESKLRVIQPRIFGKNRNVLKCRLEDQQGNQMEAVYFGEVEDCLQQMEKKQIMSFTYYPSINEYMGRRTIQLTIVNYQ